MGKPVGVDTSGSSAAPPLDEQLAVPLDALGEADAPDATPEALGEADELDDGDFEDVLDPMAVDPQAVAPTIANTTTAASGAHMADFIGIVARTRLRGPSLIACDG